MHSTAAEFVAAKPSEREDRLRLAGQSRDPVEPNVKDGKGGLRDLHTLFWIGKYVYRVRSPRNWSSMACSIRTSEDCSVAAKTSSGPYAVTCIS